MSYSNVLHQVLKCFFAKSLHILVAQLCWRHCWFFQACLLVQGLAGSHMSVVFRTASVDISLATSLSLKQQSLALCGVQQGQIELSPCKRFLWQRKPCALRVSCYKPCDHLILELKKMGRTLESMLGYLCFIYSAAARQLQVPASPATRPQDASSVRNSRRTVMDPTDTECASVSAAGRSECGVHKSRNRASLRICSASS